MTARNRSVSRLSAGLLAAGALAFGVGTLPSGASSDQSTYLRTTAISATLVQWIDVRGTLSGTFDTVTAAPGYSSITTKACSLDGSESGSSLTVTIACPGAAATRLSGDVTDNGIVLDEPQPSGAVEQVAFTRGSVAAYDKAVSRLDAKSELPSLKAWLALHNVAASGVGLQPGLRTAPFQENGQTWAVVAYNSSPKVVPILAPLRWDGSSWSSAWSAVVFNGWTGLPYKLTQLTLGHGVLGFGLNGVQFAGDDSPGAMMSNAGGKWQLIPFLLPIGTDAFGSGLQTTTLISPTFGPGAKATMDQVWDAGQCQEIQAFTYVVPREVFAPVGNLRDDFKSSFCKAY